MSEILNLRLKRKRKAREREEAEAANRRARFGVTLAARRAAQSQRERDDRSLEGHRRDLDVTKRADDEA